MSRKAYVAKSLSLLWSLIFIGMIGMVSQEPLRTLPIAGIVTAVVDGADTEDTEVKGAEAEDLETIWFRCKAVGWDPLQTSQTAFLLHSALLWPVPQQSKHKRFFIKRDTLSLWTIFLNFLHAWSVCWPSQWRQGGAKALEEASEEGITVVAETVKGFLDEVFLAWEPDLGLKLLDPPDCLKDHQTLGSVLFCSPVPQIQRPESMTKTCVLHKGCGLPRETIYPEDRWAIYWLLIADCLGSWVDRYNQSMSWHCNNPPVKWYILRASSHHLRESQAECPASSDMTEPAERDHHTSCPTFS